MINTGMLLVPCATRQALFFSKLPLLNFRCRTTLHRVRACQAWEGLTRTRHTTQGSAFPSPQRLSIHQCPVPPPLRARIEDQALARGESRPVFRHRTRPDDHLPSSSETITPPHPPRPTPGITDPCTITPATRTQRLHRVVRYVGDVVNRSLGQPVVAVAIDVVCRTLSIRTKTSIHDVHVSPWKLGGHPQDPLCSQQEFRMGSCRGRRRGNGWEFRRTIDGLSRRHRPPFFVGIVRIFSIVRERKREGDDWRAVDRIRNS